ncbi:MAG: hypothetical protein ACRDBM_17860 [Sporomusa sp.]
MEEQDHIVREYKSGETTIRISNLFYKDVTPEDINKTLRKIESEAVEYFRRRPALKNGGHLIGPPLQATGRDSS